jgi:hypothetical protein
VSCPKLGHVFTIGVGTPQRLTLPLGVGRCPFERGAHVMPPPPPPPRPTPPLLGYWPAVVPHGWIMHDHAHDVELCNARCYVKATLGPTPRPDPTRPEADT